MKNVMLLILLTMAASCVTTTWQQQLQKAIFFGDAEAVKSLLAEQPDAAELNELFPSGNTPLMLAVEREALHIAKLLLQHGADASRPGRRGVQPLHLATHRSMAALLLENGASPTAVDSMGNTPLHKVKNAAVARLLLEKGADVGTRNQHDFTPIETAVIAGRVDVFDELAGNWVRLTADDLERLRRLGKREKAMATRLAEYQLPKDVVVNNPAAPVVSTTTGGGVKKAPAQSGTTPKPKTQVAPSSKPQPTIDKTCRECQGKGWVWPCEACGGTGQMFSDVPDGYGGTYRIYYPCTVWGCNGTGKLSCYSCDGTRIDRRFWR